MIKYIQEIIRNTVVTTLIQNMIGSAKVDTLSVVALLREDLSFEWK